MRRERADGDQRARDLGESDRFKLYEGSKTLLATPPKVIRVNEKHVPEFNVPNVVGVVITTNHRTSGLYLPADDRRHYVAWSETTRVAFDDVRDRVGYVSVPRDPSSNGDGERIKAQAVYRTASFVLSMPQAIHCPYSLGRGHT